MVLIIIIIFVVDYCTFCLGKQQSDEHPIKLGSHFAYRQTPSIFHAWQPSPMFIFYAAGSINTATVYHVPWVVDSDWIIASVLQITSRAVFHILWMAEHLLKKMALKRKCKFNEDWRRDLAWIAKLPDNGMAQCNLCAMALLRDGGVRC